MVWITVGGDSLGLVDSFGRSLGMKFGGKTRGKVKERPTEHLGFPHGSKRTKDSRRNSPNIGGREFSEGNFVWDTIDRLSDKLQIGRLEDWYRVSFRDIKRLAPGSLVNKGTLGKMLQEIYPEHPWDIPRLTFKTGAVRASQRKLFLVARELFPSSGKAIER